MIMKFLRFAWLVMTLLMEIALLFNLIMFGKPGVTTTIDVLFILTTVLLTIDALKAG